MFIYIYIHSEGISERDYSGDAAGISPGEDIAFGYPPAEERFRQEMEHGSPIKNVRTTRS